MNDFTKEELEELHIPFLMNGFKINEVGYGFDEGEMYSYTRTLDTDSMGNLFKTKKEAIFNEINDAEKYIQELKGMLDE